MYIYIYTHIHLPIVRTCRLSNNTPELGSCVMSSTCGTIGVSRSQGDSANPVLAVSNGVCGLSSTGSSINALGEGGRVSCVISSTN